MRQASRIITFVLSFFIAFTVLIISGCEGSSGSRGTARFAGTQSPGDFWSWTIDSGLGSFRATNITKSFNYSGSATALAGNSAGISKLSVTTTTDPSLTTLPTSAYVVEVPNTALLVATAPFVTGTFSGIQGSIRPPVFAVAQGSCPSTGTNVNWITMPSASWCPTAGADNPLGNGCSSADNAYGTAAISVSGGTYGISVTPYQLDGTPGSGAFSLSGCTCSNGLIQCTDASSKPVRIEFTPSGVFFVDTANDANAGIVQPDSAIDIADFLKNARTFKGLWYTSLDSIGNFGDSQSDCTAHGGTWFGPGLCGTHSTQPISATTDGTQFTGHGFSNIDNGTIGTQGGSINFGANPPQPVPGLIRGKFTSVPCSEGGPTPPAEDIVMAIRQVNNKYVGLLVTHSPCATFDVGFNVLAVEQ